MSEFKEETVIYIHELQKLIEILASISNKAKELQEAFDRVKADGHRAFGVKSDRRFKDIIESFADVPSTKYE